MSTPTTATATLPQYSGFRSFPHQPSYLQSLPASYPPVSTTQNGVHLPPPAAMTNGAAVSSHPRAVYSAHSSQLDSSSINSSHSHYTTSRDGNGPASIRTSVTENSTNSATTTTTTSAATTTTATTTTTTGGMPVLSHSPDSTQLSRKRRRPGPPDWEKFYKNGLPQEVIVIEDSPEAETRSPTSAAPALHEMAPTRPPMPIAAIPRPPPTARRNT